jgi:nicotinamidase-related amidase
MSPSAGLGGQHSNKGDADMAEWTRPRFAVSPETTALVVIDMQNDFIAEGAPYESPHGREMIESLNTLIAACREKRIPIVFTVHAHRADGSDLGAVRHIHPLTADGHALKADTAGVQMYPKVDIAEGDYKIQKRRYSAFYATDLELLLRNLGVDTVIIAGVATNVEAVAPARLSLDEQAGDLWPIGRAVHSREAILVNVPSPGPASVPAATRALVLPIAQQDERAIAA